jgi:hypothetical protein
VLPDSASVRWVISDVSAWASIVGVVISIAGFALTLWQLRKTRTAARAASEAATQARDAIELYDAAVDLGSAITTLEEVKRLYRAQVFAVVPDRYSAVRRLIVAVRAAATTLSDAERIMLQGVIQQLAQLEREVEDALGTPRPNIDVAKHNAIVGRHIDSLAAVAATLRRQE